MDSLSTAMTALAALRSTGEAGIGLTGPDLIAETRLTFAARVNDMYAAVLSLEASRQEAAQAKALLEEKSRELEERHAQLQAYEFVEAVPGQFARARKPLGDGPYKEPYFCEPCSREGKMIPMERSDAGPGRNLFYRCALNAKHCLIAYGTASPLPPEKA